MTNKKSSRNAPNILCAKQKICYFYIAWKLAYAANSSSKITLASCCPLKKDNNTWTICMCFQQKLESLKDY